MGQDPWDKWAKYKYSNYCHKIRHRDDEWHRWAKNKQNSVKQAMKRRRKDGEAVTPPSLKEFRELAEGQRHRCALTGLKLKPEIASIDHVVAASDGGGDTMENLQVVHKEVNRIKGALSMADLYKWCERILAGRML